MRLSSRLFAVAVTTAAALCAPSAHAAAAPKIHTVTFGPARKVPYTPAFSTPSTKDEDSSSLRIRPLFIDSKQKEWTVGEAHAISDRTFAVRRALHINDSLPNDPGERWVWQPATWILVDRTTGHITALHLPSFDPILSNAVWFRDYVAYCGLATASARSADAGKSNLVAVIAQAGGRKAVAQRPVGRWPQPEHTSPACEPARWQRLPMRATLQPTGGDPVTFDVIGSTSLIEEGDNDEE